MKLLLLIILLGLSNPVLATCWGNCGGGVQGQPGEQGEQGPKGDKGDKCDTGMKGMTGMKGDTGESGSDGVGIQGIAGTNGVDGKAGLNLTDQKNYLDDQGYWTDDEISELFAAATAMSGLDFDSTTTKTQIGIAIGGYDGEESMAIGVGKVWDSETVGDILFSFKTTGDVSGRGNARPWVGSAVWEF